MLTNNVLSGKINYAYPVIVTLPLLIFIYDHIIYTTHSEPLTVFAKRDDQLTKPMKVFFDLFLQIGDEATAPSDACGPAAKVIHPYQHTIHTSSNSLSALPFSVHTSYQCIY